MIGANRISKNIFLAPLVLGVFDQSHEMVKHTQKIRRHLFEFVWPFCEIGA